ncbi:beta-galactosidase [bacterium]|nr:beta-galactosidase [bacterium]
MKRLKYFLMAVFIFGQVGTIMADDVNPFKGATIKETEQEPIKDIGPKPFEIDKNTVLLLHMDEGGGNTVHDPSANSFNGTTEGTTQPSWIEGKFGNGLEFNGTSSFVRIDDSAAESALDLQEPFTIEAWIKARGVAERNMIVDKYDYISTTPGIYSPAGTRGYTLSLYNGVIRFNIMSGLDTCGGVTGGPDLRDNRWHHVAGVWTGKQLKIYLDGALLKSLNWDHAPAQANWDLAIGARTRFGGSCFFDGMIDEVRISNTVRAFFTVKLDEDAVLLHLDEGSGDKASDSSAYANHGMINGANWTTGKLNGGLLFDGVDDYIKMPWSSGLNITDKITLQAWICIKERRFVNQRIISKLDSYRLLVNGDQFLMELNLGNIKEVIASDSILIADRWYHIAGTYDSETRAVNLYINGLCVKSTILRNLSDYKIAANVTNVTIGAGSDSREPFNGIIDEVEISNVVRTFFPLEKVKEKPLLTKARWIWYPEDPSLSCRKQWRYFRKSFKIIHPVKSSSLWITADNAFNLYVNGKEIGKSDDWQKVMKYDISHSLKEGTNIIAVEAYNEGSMAALMLKGILELSSGDKQFLFSDSSWKVSKKIDKSWMTSSFDDSSWKKGYIIGDAFSAPWADRFDNQLFADTHELAQRRMAKEKLIGPLNFLNKEKKASCRIDLSRGFPAFIINEKPYPAIYYLNPYSGPFSSCGERQIENFKKAGVHIYELIVILKKTWLSPGEYDFTASDNEMRRIISIDPQAFILFSLSLEPPDWWMDKHPDEWIGYATGPVVPAADESGRAKRASLASKVWREEVGQVLRDWIKHLEGTQWGKRIISCETRYGGTSEWYYYGQRWDMPDTGKAMTQKFREWLRKKYGSVSLLKKAWGDPAVNFENATIPDKKERLTNSLLVFKDPHKECKVLDYYHCHDEVIAEDILYFGKIVKEETNQRVLYGVYYGYLFGMCMYPPEFGHGAQEKVLSSPLVDYFISPSVYKKRMMGGDGQLRHSVESMRLHGKLSIQDADIRTHIASKDFCWAANLTESIAKIRRQFCHSLAWGVAFMWADFGREPRGGWYDDPIIMENIARMQEIAQESLELNRGSVSEVALIYDLESLYYLEHGQYPRTFTSILTTEIHSELFKCGIPFDVILLNDLGKKELPDYKVYIFLNCFVLTQEQRLCIEKVTKRNDKVILWLYAPGFIDEEGASDENISSLIGMKVKSIREKAPQVIEISASHSLTQGLPTIKRTLPTNISKITSLSELTDVDKWSHKSLKLLNHTLKAENNVMRWKFHGGQGGYTPTNIFKNYVDTNIFAERIKKFDFIGMWVKNSAASSFGLQMHLWDGKQTLWSVRPQIVLPGKWQQVMFAKDDYYCMYHPDSPIKPEEITFPLHYLRLFLDINLRKDYDLSLKDLETFSGGTKKEEIACFGKELLIEGPVFYVDDPTVTVLGLQPFKSKKLPAFCLKNFKGWTSIYISIPFVSRDVLQNIFEYAGVHRYLDTKNDIIYANKSMLSIHTKEGGKKIISLPQPMDVYDAFAQKVIGKEISSFTVNIPPCSTVLYLLRRPSDG